MCPSCGEQNPVVAGEGVCSVCAAMYAEADPNWQQTEWGRFLVGSNLETARMAERIANEPTGYAIEDVPEPIMEETRPTIQTSAGVDEMIEALINRHKFGYRKVYAFLLNGGYDAPSLSTVKRRIARLRKADNAPVYADRGAAGI